MIGRTAFQYAMAAGEEICIGAFDCKHKCLAMQYFDFVEQADRMNDRPY